MITFKEFEGLEQLNEFITINKVKTISIETIKFIYDTGMPLPKGGSFKTEREKIKLWYEE